MMQSQAEHVFFACSPPMLQELCSVIVHVPQPPSTVPGKSQPHVIRCRELIFTEPDIIATPMLYNESAVCIIMQQSLYKSGKLQGRFQKMGLQAEKPRRVTPVDFQACLRYTLLAKLAPAWNKVGDYLVQGRDFLSCRQKLNAIGLDLTVNESELYFTLQASNIKIPLVSLEDLGLCRPMVQEFMASRPHGQIPEQYIENKWCYILPSMKKGLVVGVSHTIPLGTPFHAYKDIKRHWKNTYGYRLPEDDQEILYYQVYFKPIGERLFTYPELCIRPRGILTFPRSDPQPILTGFLADLQCKVPNICGQKLKLSCQPNFLTSQLLEMQQVIQTSVPDEIRYNLTKQRPDNIRIRSQNTQFPSFNGSYVGAHSTPLPYIKTINGSQNLEPVNKPKLTENKDSTNLVTNSDNNLRKSRYDAVTYVGSKPCSNAPVKPIFKVKKPASSSKSSEGTSIISSSAPPRTVPKFVPLRRPNMTSKAGSSACNDGFMKSQVDRSSISAAPISKPSDSQAIPTSLAPKFAPRGPKSALSAPTNKEQGMPKPKPHTGKVGHQTPSDLFKLPSSHTSSFDVGIWNTSNHGSQPNNVNNSGNKSFSSQSPGGCSQSSLDAESDFTSAVTKRKLQQVDDNRETKKPKSKPRIRDDLEVEILARNNQLAKVNAATLTSWLKKRGVPCRAKDKKADLLVKVLMTLNLVQHES